MKTLLFLSSIIITLNQLQKTENSEKKNEKQNKEIKSLIIKYDSFNVENLEIIKDKNDNERKFILNQNTYIIYPSYDKKIEDYGSMLSRDIKNFTGLEIGVTPNMAMKMSNKVKNNFIQIILEKMNQENKNQIVNIKINHRKIIIKSKELIGIRNGIKIISNILSNNRKINMTYDEVVFEPIEIILKSNITNSNYVYAGLIVSILLISMTLYFYYLKNYIN